MGVPHLGGMVLYSRGGVLTRNYPINFLARIHSLTKTRISVEKKCDTLCAFFSVTLWEGLFLNKVDLRRDCFEQQLRLGRAYNHDTDIS